MRLSESGRITFKAFLSLLFLAVLAFAAFKIIPVYVNDYQLGEYMQNQTPFWLTQRVPAEAIQKSVVARAQELGLPLAAEDVTVSANANKISVTIDYHVPVDFLAFTLPLHFSHTSANTAIQ